MADPPLTILFFIGMVVIICLMIICLMILIGNLWRTFEKYNYLKSNIYDSINTKINSSYYLKLKFNKNKSIKLVTLNDNVYFHIHNVPNIEIKSNVDVIYINIERGIKQLMHDKAVKYCNETYKKDITCYEFRNPLISINEFEIKGIVYFHGHNEKEKFVVDFVCNDISTLLNKNLLTSLYSVLISIICTILIIPLSFFIVFVKFK